MVDRSPIKGKTIVIADRGYESYNNFAHLERKGWNYVIRVKDLNSNGLLSGLRLPSSGEFDRNVHLTPPKNKPKRSSPRDLQVRSFHVYIWFFDLHENLFYPISFRVVHFVLPQGAYETVITNLSAANFPPDEIKSIYNRRWGIKTSFRALKVWLCESALQHRAGVHRAVSAGNVYKREQQPWSWLSMGAVYPWEMTTFEVIISANLYMIILAKISWVMDSCLFAWKFSSSAPIMKSCRLIQVFFA